MTAVSGLSISQKAPAGAAEFDPTCAATDGCDFGRSDLDPVLRARFWRCYFCGVALLIVAIFLFI
jgi:hypothetical protein